MIQASWGPCQSVDMHMDVSHAASHLNHGPSYPSPHTHVDTHTNTHAHTRPHTHTHAHTHTHTHTHKHGPVGRESRHRVNLAWPLRAVARTHTPSHTHTHTHIHTHTLPAPSVKHEQYHATADNAMTLAVFNQHYTWPQRGLSSGVGISYIRDGPRIAVNVGGAAAAPDPGVGGWGCDGSMSRAWMSYLHCAGWPYSLMRVALYPCGSGVFDPASFSPYRGATHTTFGVSNGVPQSNSTYSATRDAPSQTHPACCTPV